MRSVPFVAVLDANVLFSNALRNLLLTAYDHDLYQARFSDHILQEVKGSLTQRRDASIADSAVARLRAGYPEALVERYESLISAMKNDVGDKHVLAAAVHAGAQVIVTNNLRDFPYEAVSPYAIEVQTPDDFLVHLWDLDRETMLAVVNETAGLTRRRNPRDIVEQLASQAPTFRAVVLAEADFSISPPRLRR